MSDRMLHIRLAESRADVLRCQQLIAGIYNQAYQVVFSESGYDLEAKIEPWPHRYVMGFFGDDLVCAAGLYLDNTYVERFGQVTPDEFKSVIDEAGAAPRFDWRRKREYTKIVVREDMRGRGLARFFLAATMSRDFLQVGTQPDEPAVLVICGKVSILGRMWESIGIRLRPIKPFPIYRVHELYSSPADPMVTRMIIPEIDIPPKWYNLELPGTYAVTEAKAEAQPA
jgi:hypothetical protein